MGDVTEVVFNEYEGLYPAITPSRERTRGAVENWGGGHLYAPLALFVDSCLGGAGWLVWRGGNSRNRAGTG